MCSSHRRHKRFLQRLILVLIVSCCGSALVLAKPSQRSTPPQARRQSVSRNPASGRKPSEPAESIAPLLAGFRASFDNGCYESAFMNLNNVAASFYDVNNFPAAMQAYKIFANFADPITTIDPSDRQDELIRKSTVIKDMSRNYVKFMLNTQLVHPELCRTTKCVELAWEMMEKVKSRLLRVDLINSAFSRLDVHEKATVQGLIGRLKTERIARSQLRVATGNLVGPTEKDPIIADLEVGIARYLPEYTNLAGESASLQRVRETLTDNEILLSFVYTNNERKVYVFRLDKSEPFDPAKAVVKTDINTELLSNSIERIKKAIVDEKSLAEISGPSGELLGLDGIYQGLLQKLNLPANRRLIIATDQNLSALPFDLLPWKSGQRMIDLFDIHYVPSATVFYYLRSKRLGPSKESVRLCWFWLQR
jgi:hypothetical protein